MSQYSVIIFNNWDNTSQQVEAETKDVADRIREGFMAVNKKSADKFDVYVVDKVSGDVYGVTGVNYQKLN